MDYKWPRSDLIKSTKMFEIIMMVKGSTWPMGMTTEEDFWKIWGEWQQRTMTYLAWCRNTSIRVGSCSIAWGASRSMPLQRLTRKTLTCYITQWEILKKKSQNFWRKNKFSWVLKLKNSNFRGPLTLLATIHIHTCMYTEQYSPQWEKKPTRFATLTSRPSASRFAPLHSNK